jgi:hypothetical protein
MVVHYGGRHFVMYHPVSREISDDSSFHKARMHRGDGKPIEVIPWSHDISTPTVYLCFICMVGLSFLLSLGQCIRPEYFLVLRVDLRSI